MSALIMTELTDELRPFLVGMTEGGFMAVPKSSELAPGFVAMFDGEIAACNEQHAVNLYVMKNRKRHLEATMRFAKLLDEHDGS